MAFFDRFLKRESAAEPPAQLKAVFDKIRDFLADETAQNEMYPLEAMRAIQAGAALDQVPGGSGEFGRDARNPIPVNGFIGELLYVSQLRTSGGAQMIGHRVGSIGDVDIFELVSVDETLWDVLYFDLYQWR